ncbi:MAG: trypsin-like serine protease [Elusimicrobia bacterium]|nr:trypsin-like serine protease [Elusimicrobiota bacterium]
MRTDRLLPVLASILLAALMPAAAAMNGAAWTPGAPEDFLQSMVGHSFGQGFKSPVEQVNVFTGTRRQAITSNAYPWSAIGRLKLAKGTGNSWCTASLIARDLILTNAHCIEDEDGNIIRGAYRFFPNMVGGQARAGSDVVHMWWGTSGVNPNTRAQDDWAILRIRDPLGTSYGTLGVKTMEFTEDLNLHLAAYSGDYNGGLTATFSRDCRITGQDDRGALLHNCSSTKGSSGGPLLWFDGEQKPWVVAVNRGERRDGRNESLVNIPYSHRHANIAVSASRFLSTLRSILGAR